MSVEGKPGQRAQEICASCGLPVRSKARGSITAWIFRDNRCTCKSLTDIVLSAATAQASGVPELHALDAGQLIDGKYKVLSVIGRGGMGTVFRVEDTRDSRQYALKTLNPQHTSSVMWQRFQKEAQAARVLDHPGLVKVHYFGSTEKGEPFFVMDFVDGETLAARIKRDGPLPVEEAIKVFIQICFALGYAHSQSVVHRDLKPSNVIFASAPASAEESIKIVDFGIAKVLRGDDFDSEQLTATGEIFGTPYYMSPEQCRSAMVDHRSDIYSLGCVMYEALTGLPPFFGEAPLSIMMKHQADKPLSLKEASLGKEFPDDLEKVIAKLLEKSVDQRYQSLYDVASDLNRIMTGRGLRVAVDAGSSKQSHDHGSKRWAIAVGMIVALGIGAGLGRYSQPAIHQDQPIKQDSKKIDAYSMEMLPPMTVPGPKAIQSGFYSSFLGDNPTTRYFHFYANPDETLGKILVEPPLKSYRIENGKITERQSNNFFGDLLVQNFRPFHLDMSMAAIQHPEMLKGLRPDEVYQLGCKGTPIAGEGLKYLEGWQALEILNIYPAEGVSDSCLPYLDSLPRLKSLALQRSSMSGETLARLKRLLEMRDLTIQGMKSVDKVLIKLSRSKAICYLDLAETSISDKDIDVICTYSNLEHLRLNATSITDAGVARLSQLKSLHSLDISGCKITMDCAKSLERFPNLKRVTLLASSFTAPQRNALVRRLRKCQVDFNLDAGTEGPPPVFVD